MADVEVLNGGSAKVVDSVPVTFTAVKPQLFVEATKTADAVSFYKAAFGAAETGRTVSSKRKADQELPLILSAQLELAGVTFVVSDVSSDDSTLGKTEGESSRAVTICLETEDVEAAITKAVNAGAVAEGEITEGGESQCCGGRVGKVKDPYGFFWVICSASKPTVVEVAA
ncbi:hypothetical protein ACFE04_003608 [Oxalis oulophora]